MRVVRPCISSLIVSMMAASVVGSSAEVGSSSRRIGAFFRNARAMPMRWRWPTLDVRRVRRPGCHIRCGKRLMNSSACARRAASRISVVGRVGPAVGDVFADGGGKKKRVLEDDRDLRAQRFLRDLAHIAAIERDTTPAFGS